MGAGKGPTQSLPSRYAEIPPHRSKLCELCADGFVFSKAPSLSCPEGHDMDRKDVKTVGNACTYDHVNKKVKKLTVSEKENCSVL